MKILLVNKFLYPVGGAEEAVALWEGETTLAVSGETVIPSVFA